MRYYSRILQFLQSSSGCYGSFFPLIIHIQRSKLHFGPHDENEENKRKEYFFDI